LLDRIAGYDGRTFASSAEESWLQLLGGYPLADCLRAVDEHYAINTDRVMPADVRSRCLTLRDLRAAAEQRALPAPTGPVLTERGLEAKREVFRLIRQVARRSEVAMRPMRADPTNPTSADSPIDEVERQRQIRRLRHEGRR
jgi:hypothetical protein